MGDHNLADHGLADHDHPATENPHAGQGPVLLDIGEDVGALVLTMPSDMDGVEVEARRRNGDQPLMHVGVVGRLAGGALVHSAVFPGLPRGDYDLYQRPAGPVRLTLHIEGGQVAHAQWPVTGD